MLGLNQIYQWEIETVDGVVTPQYQPDGMENSWKKLDPEKIVRFSYVPAIPGIHRHDLLFDLPKGYRFVKRFGTGALRQQNGFQLSEYVYVVVTNTYRYHVFASNGRALIGPPDLEINP